MDYEAAALRGEHIQKHSPYPPTATTAEAMTLDSPGFQSSDIKESVHAEEGGSTAGSGRFSPRDMAMPVQHNMNYMQQQLQLYDLQSADMIQLQHQYQMQATWFEQQQESPHSQEMASQGVFFAGRQAYYMATTEESAATDEYVPVSVPVLVPVPVPVPLWPLRKWL